MRMRLLSILLLTGIIFALTGCGGGGGGGTTPTPTPTPTPIVNPTKAIVKLATSGTLPAGTTIGAIDATVNYSTNKGLTIADSGVVASGVATGGILVPNTNIAGQVRLGNLTLSATGFPIGEFATLTFNIASGNSPVSSDFTVAPGASIFDVNSNQPNTVSIVIQSVTFQ